MAASPDMASAPMRPYPGILAAVGLCLAVVLLQVGLGLAFGAALPALGLSLPLLGVIGIANTLAFALVICWAVWRGGRRWTEALPFRAVRPVLYLPLAVMLIGFGILASELDNLTRAVAPMPEQVAAAFEKIAKGGVASLITVIAVAPITEELFFRGIILQGFLARYGVQTALVVSALIFGLVHLNPYQFFSAFILGMVLGWVFLRTRSLWPCLAGHAIFNGHSFVIVALVPFNIRGYNPETVDLRVVEFQPWWLDLTGLAALLIGFVWLCKVLPARATPQGSAR